MNSIPIIVIGIIIVIFGIIFNFQGQGIIGPEQSFMTESSIWIDSGISIAMGAVIIILIR